MNIRSMFQPILVFGLLFGMTAQAMYSETMDPKGLSKDLGADYGLIDDKGEANQSAIFQKAIDEVSKAGGGRLIVPKGTYKIASVKFKSNVHILVTAGTVFKLDWPAGGKAMGFLMDAERPAKKKQWTEQDEMAYIENVSIRGLGGRWTFDYSDRERAKGEGSRAILTKMVKNFLIADLDVKDNYSTYCGITLTPMQTDYDNSNWPITRSTDGLVRNCRIFNASPGYGLTQLHGAQDVHFEDIYAEGGVTLRLETGAVGNDTAVYDITAKNVTNENGRCAVMMGPHSAMNGLVTIENVTSIGSTLAVSIGLAGVKAAELEKHPDAVDGKFAEGSSIKNIHAIFGMHAQVKKHAIMSIPEEYYPDLWLRWENKFFDGPSIGAVKDTTDGHYKVILENITMEGFKYNSDKAILTKADAREGKWGAEVKKWEAQYGKGK